MATPTQTRRILIKVDTKDAKGLEDIAGRMGLLNKNTKSLSNNMGFLTNAFRGWLGYLGVRELAHMSDEMQNITNRLKIFTGSTDGAREALGQIAAVADRTNQSVSAVGDVYARLAVSLQGTKATTGEITALTESLINTFRVAGATTTETTNTIIQLSQAFASGQLRGQELRSVMEQNATLAGLLRKRFGQDIYKKAQEGAISVTEVLKVLAENQAKISAQAKELAPTFEQTLAKAMNKVSLAVGDLSKQYELHEKFAAAVGFTVDNLGTILTVVGGIIATVAIAKIPAMVKSLQELRVAMLAVTESNPLLLALAGVATLVAVVSENLETVVKWAKQAEAIFFDFASAIAGVNSQFLVWQQNLLKIDNGDRIGDSLKAVVKYKAAADDIRAGLKKDQDLAALVASSATSGAKDPKAELESLIKKMGSLKEKTKSLKGELSELNKQYLSGAITIGEYNAKLINFQIYKVNREFKEGKTDIFKYHEQLRDLNIQALNRDFAAGIITLDEFNGLVAANKIDVLREQLDSGRISLTKYNEEMNKLEDKVRPDSAFQSGVQNYIESVGTLSQNITKGIEQAFGHLEESLTDFIKTGTFNFKTFTQAILDDLTAIIIRASIIRPLAQGILSIGTSAAAPAATASANTTAAFAAQGVSAKGNAFVGGNIIPFAKGGIVDSPTAFTYGGGKNKGIMGEAGTEAILPLKRSGNGDLGVTASLTPVTVNIINQSGADVQQTEKTGPNGERQIDILIAAKVREGIASGKYDTAMKSAYGITRKGS